VGGPPGWIALGGYFIIDNTVGWQRALGMDRVHPNWSFPNSYLLPVNKR
jgi:hypothetical protein